MPHFSRTQLGVSLLLGAALLLIWAWRGNFGLSPSPPPASTPNHPVYVEVAGAAARPGVFEFPQPPALSQVLAEAGAAASPGPADPKLASGSKVEVTGEGRYRLGRMDGPKLMTLGLALDLNRAAAADLEALPGIGPTLAQRIVAYRQTHGPFKNIGDLEQVSGIGPKKLAQVKPYVVIGENADND
ncbi:MAG: helix-hairpin-helix domain-containing protein [Deltaproteobacteria bacterium]|nr:MAG: helix-hairpin-helix domain-containing protein [Deltaproteobacteria bacterium]